MVKLSFKNIIIINVFLFFIIFSFTMFLIFAHFYTKSIIQRFTAANKSSVKVTENIIINESNKLSTMARNITNDYVSRQLMANGLYYKSNSLDGVLTSEKAEKSHYRRFVNEMRTKYKSVEEMDNMYSVDVDLYDADAKPLATTSYTVKPDIKDYYFDDFFNNIPTPTDYYTMIRYEDNSFYMGSIQTISLSYTSIFTPKGIVFVRKKMDAAFIDKIKTVTNKEIIVVKDNKILISTFFKDTKRIVEFPLKRKIDDFEKEYFLKIENKIWVFNFTGLRNYKNEIIGYVGVGFSTKDFEEVASENVGPFLLFGSIIGLIIFILLYIILKVLFKPFSLLVEKVESIKEGKYVKIEMKGRKEIRVLIKSINNLSESVEARERDLQTLNRELEERVEERTRELKDTIDILNKTQEQLIISEKIASVGKLAGSIAHEINSPLGAILTSAQFMKIGLDDIKENEVRVEFSESIGVIEEATKKSREIIQKLLKSINRGEARFEILDLEDTIKSGYQMIKEELEKSNIKTVFELESNIRIKGNSSELINVVFNIMSNSKEAIIKKASKEGVIRVSATQEDNFVIIRIEDNGIGMDDAVKIKAFDPFFTTKSIGEGLGLGLTVTYDIINKHGGKIDLLSEEGKGTVVVIELPL